MSATVDRRRIIGGSDARIIMGGDEARLLRLWREKRGEVEPEDLSDNLIVQLGTVTEELNRRWYERNTGHVIKDVQRRVKHPIIKWMAATLDGLVDPSGAVFEAKFMLPWTFSEEAAAEKHNAGSMSRLSRNGYAWIAWPEPPHGIEHLDRVQRLHGKQPALPVGSATLPMSLKRSRQTSHLRRSSVS